MAKAIERIEKDLAVIEQTVANLATELHNTYSRYLTAMGQAMRQQLILATYHLCTQSYPEEFLYLSFSQRQKLQENIKKFGDKAKETLTSQLQFPTPEVTNYLSASEENKAEEKAENIATDEQEINQSPTSELKLTNPEDLAHWQEKLEKAIAKILQKLSRDTNLLLQRTGILPKKLPEPILEAAAKVEAAAESIPGPPNLLSLVIETENEQEPENSSVTQLVTIHLRLSEIEFTDSNLAAFRHHIRNLSVKLQTVRRDYEKKQREKAVAQAELAWRVSWFDE